MIDLLGHIRFDGMDILYYGNLGYAMWIVTMAFAYLGVFYLWRLIFNLIRKIESKHKCERK